MARLGRILGAAAGFALAGPLGMSAGMGILGGGLLGHSYDEGRRGKKEAMRLGQEQENAYKDQSNRIRQESERLSKQLESSKNKVEQGIARAGRSRIRGGIFGDNQPSGNLNQRLG